MKALILSAHKNKSDPLPPKPPYKDNKSPNRFTLAELHQLLRSQYESAEIESMPKDTDDDTTCLVNFSQAKEVAPGDISNFYLFLIKGDMIMQNGKLKSTHQKSINLR